MAETNKNPLQTLHKINTHWFNHIEQYSRPSQAEQATARTNCYADDTVSVINLRNKSPAKHGIGAYRLT